MNILLDTHVFLWWLYDSPRLGQDLRSVIADSDNEVFISSASAWEIATKHRLGKLPEVGELLADYTDLLDRARFSELSVNSVHALRAGSLAIAHRDPFDRMLMAQALIENMPILTYDDAFKQVAVARLPE